MIPPYSHLLVVVLFISGSIIYLGKFAFGNLFTKDNLNV